jgi:hypothetical protein
MVEASSHTIVTAISDSSFESFVSSNLHSQGWDIIARAVDFAALQVFLKQNPEVAKKSILIFAPDLPGYSEESFSDLRPLVGKIIGYGTEVELNSFESLTPRPTDPAELVSQIRAILRREFREPLISNHKVSNLGGAKVIAIASAGSATGATTLAVNLAMESSLLEKRTLLIDGNSIDSHLVEVAAAAVAAAAGSSSEEGREALLQDAQFYRRLHGEEKEAGERVR